MPADEVQRYASDDAVMSAMGVEVVELEAGRAVVSVTVAARHVDQRGVLSRGVAFTVADAAIALASNAYGPVALLVHADAHWLADVPVGSRLTATCRVVQRDPTTATFESRLTTGDCALAGVVWGTTRSPRH